MVSEIVANAYFFDNDPIEELTEMADGAKPNMAIVKDKEESPDSPPKPKFKFVQAELLQKAQLYADRNEIYGDNYKHFGAILSLILQGQTLDTTNINQMSRLGNFVQVVSKVTRYGANFAKGGHDDSLDDICVYSMMQKELDSSGS